MNAVEQILRAYVEGYSALLLSGRSLRDFTTDDAKVRPLLALLRRVLHEQHGMVFITYSMAEGLDWDESRTADERDRRTIEKVLKTHHLFPIPQDQNEIVRGMRGIAAHSPHPHGRAALG